MNARDHMKPTTIEYIPLTAITPSPTNPRKHFDQAALKELADNILAQGIVQPIVVRPLAKTNLDTKKYEIVAGERRWRASKIAGLAHVPAIVRDLSDVAVLEIQITENLQRQDLDPLEEAAGYKQLMALKKINTDQLAELIGKSRSYVYTRTKLNDLCPEARTALEKGELDASRALLIARIGHHDNQRQALKAAIKKDYQGDMMSYRELHHHIQQNYMLALKAAPFDPKDEKLVPKAGSCAVCPKRAGNQPELFQDIKGADVCTDPKCFTAKRDAHWHNVRCDAIAKGKTVISGKDARQIFPSRHDEERAGAGYTTLTQTSYDDPKNRKVRDIIGKDSKDIELVQNPHSGALIEVVKTSAVTAALNAKGIKTQAQKVAKARGTTGSGSSPESRAKQEREEKIQQQVDLAIIRAVHDKQPTKIGRPELQRLCKYILEGDVDLSELCHAWGEKYSSSAFTLIKKKINSLTTDKLVVLLLDLLLNSECQVRYNQDPYFEVARALKVDAKGIERKIRAVHKAEDDATKMQLAKAPKTAAKKKPVKK